MTEPNRRVPRRTHEKLIEGETPHRGVEEGRRYGGRDLIYLADGSLSLLPALYAVCVCLVQTTAGSGAEKLGTVCSSCPPAHAPPAWREPRRRRERSSAGEGFLLALQQLSGPVWMRACTWMVLGTPRGLGLGHARSARVRLVGRARGAGWGLTVIRALSSVRKLAERMIGERNSCRVVGPR